MTLPDPDLEDENAPLPRSLFHVSLLLCLLPLFLVWLGCANPSQRTGDDVARQAIASAVANGERPEADRVDDANRKPAQVLEALGIQPGMRVLDLLAGGGYYTEILSRVVGQRGFVLFHNNAAYREYLGAETLAKRTANERLPNVERLDIEVADLTFNPGELDAVILILGFHDLYLIENEGTWPIIDQPRLFRTLFHALLPGGILGIVDHSAIAGTDPFESGSGPHRIDEAFVRKALAAFGFVFESSSDVLRRPEDDRLTSVFDDSMRRRTDRFILRFRKPD